MGVASGGSRRRGSSGRPHNAEKSVGPSNPGHRTGPAPRDPLPSSRVESIHSWSRRARRLVEEGRCRPVCPLPHSGSNNTTREKAGRGKGTSPEGSARRKLPFPVLLHCSGHLSARK
ncbi:hypothetical protein HPB50_018372 [Hyalomma asiaticum]|uniref:Uncharacterized protein n=1 Tax=Hyalomma asiaticum TaxID=266040 RepID=A0ACB7TMS4_HYAAI|nr:hypothetical protein HPB50_018372 [Hyalomma asiaticum]